ncbi:MAG: type II toxin-antitoxin system VapC family toxin [Acidobacteriota bacterium]|nr:type II toxin-antitoxin system VapC family toxin [Acidobacteriota bacterium]
MNVTPPAQAVFPDSNVFIEGLVSSYGVSRAILILARLKLFRIQLSPYVEDEVERFLLRRYARNENEGSRLIEDYHLTLKLLDPERLPKITSEEIRAHQSLIRHQHDVPVLASAVKAQPDWLITANVQHFNAEVAARTGLRIVTPHAFLRQFKLP